MSRTSISFLTTAALLAAVSAERAADACTLPSSKSVHVYWTSTTAAPDDERCTYYFSLGLQCHLSGWLYKPTTTPASNLPAIVFVHGSGGAFSAGDAISQQGGCEWINYFVSRGYVVWSPVMRGVADDTGGATPSVLTSTSTGFVNTGTYVSDKAAEWSDPSDPMYPWLTVSLHGWGITSPAPKDYTALATLQYMDNEVSDIQNALTYLVGLTGAGGQPLVDRQKIMLAGHSYGGATVTLASSHALTPLPKGIVNESGGVLSWAGSDVWNNVLTYYAAEHKEPLMTRININESSTGDYTPGNAIYNAAAATGAARIRRYGSFTLTSAQQAACTAKGYGSNQCYHIYFQDDATQVARWAPDVYDFLVDKGVF